MTAALAQVSHPKPAGRSFMRVLTSVPALLFWFFVACYALTSAGGLDSADGTVVAQTALALFQRHTLALAPGTPEAVVGVGGLGYSKYGIAQSLVEIPFVVLGLALRHFTHLEWTVAWAISFTNGPITALGCAVFYLVVRRLGANARRGAALTLLYGLCTLAWPYAKSDFNEPLQTLSLLLAAYAVLRARQSGRARWLWASGGALVLLVLAKAAMLVAVPAFVLYVLSDGLLEPGWRLTLGSLRKAAWWRGVVRRELALLIPVFVAVALTLWLNAVRFGSPLDFGYSRAAGDTPFTAPIYEGVFGLLFSFNTGMIFYATPVLLGVVGWRRFARRQPGETLLIAGLAVMLLILYGSYRYWAGLAAFGPRYLVPLVPFLLLPAVDAFPGIGTQPRARRGAVALIGLVALAGFAEQMLGVIVSFGAYSTLTCHQVPCPASLDASQSELLYDIWLVRDAVIYNLSGHLPHIALADYPFGAAPTGRPNWQSGLLGRMRYFWFVPLGHIKTDLLAGMLVCGGAMVMALRGIARRVELFAPVPQSAAAHAEPVAAVAGSHAREPWD